LRAIGRNPEDYLRVLDQMSVVGAGEPRIQASVAALRAALRLPEEEQQAEARRTTARLVLTAQACLMLQHADAATAGAFRQYPAARQPRQQLPAPAERTGAGFAHGGRHR
ncbi:hypothetical protein AB4142_28870, partial [Variovorax sp. 2RAF20]